MLTCAVQCLCKRSQVRNAYVHNLKNLPRFVCEGCARPIYRGLFCKWLRRRSQRLGETSEQEVGPRASFSFTPSLSFSLSLWLDGRGERWERGVGWRTVRQGAAISCTPRLTPPPLQSTCRQTCAGENVHQPKIAPHKREVQIDREKNQERESEREREGVCEINMKEKNQCQD